LVQIWFGPQQLEPQSVPDKQWQEPLLQIWYDAHALPQLPQLPLSLSGSTHCPPQQIWLGAQALPQLPQLLLSLSGSTHCPAQFS
jgi:hypothetical protein